MPRNVHDVMELEEWAVELSVPAQNAATVTVPERSNVESVMERGLSKPALHNLIQKFC